MIMRLWRGRVPTEKAAAYLAYVEETGMSEYRSTPGILRAEMVSRTLDDGTTEILTLSWWPDLDTIRAFAGDPVDAAHYYPEDDDYLLDREPTVAHYEVYGARSDL